MKTFICASLMLKAVMVTSSDILELLECDPRHGDHVVASPVYCNRWQIRSCSQYLVLHLLWHGPHNFFLLRYLHCNQNGIKEIKICSVNENWNIDTSQCNHADKVSCGHRTQSWNEGRASENASTSSHQKESKNRSVEVVNEYIEIVID